MKGTPEMPQCGFSRASIQVLGLQGVDPSKFAAFNVLEDAELRSGMCNNPRLDEALAATQSSAATWLTLFRHQGVLRLADHSPALRRQGVRGRLRHPRFHAPERRSGQASRGEEGSCRGWRGRSRQAGVNIYALELDGRALYNIMDTKIVMYTTQKDAKWNIRCYNTTPSTSMRPRGRDKRLHRRADHYRQTRCPSSRWGRGDTE